VAIVLLYASYVGLLRGWIQGSDLSSSQVQAISFWLLGALLLVAGTGLGAVGAPCSPRITAPPRQQSAVPPIARASLSTTGQSYSRASGPAARLPTE
ncbi:MAG: hypothetical protein QOH15_511, partial [Gaiellales bacterium]|nr:hypothetical protein [Gaiellales bacterium]